MDHREKRNRERSIEVINPLKKALDELHAIGASVSAIHVDSAINDLADSNNIRRPN